MRCNSAGVCTPSPGASTVRLAAWAALLVAAVIVLHAFGDGVLATPPITEPSAWAPWARLHDPVVVVVALLRLAASTGVWYVMGITSVGVLARFLRLARVVTVTDALTVPAVRRLLQGALGLGFATATLAGVGAVTRAPEAVASAATSAAVSVDAPLIMRPLASEERLQLEPLTDDAALAPSAAPLPERNADTPVPATGEWIIRPGDHLWAAAEQTLARAWGRVPAPEEVDSYWRALVEENRARLTDPDNPDLVHPGERFTLPEVPLDPAEGDLR